MATWLIAGDFPKWMTVGFAAGALAERGWTEALAVAFWVATGGATAIPLAGEGLLSVVRLACGCPEKIIPGFLYRQR
jgi:hypothetical protein